MKIMGSFSLCVRLRHHSLNTKPDANVDVDANADVKCKHRTRRMCVSNECSCC